MGLHHGNIIREATLVVRNLGSVSRFYREVLNGEPRLEGDKAVFELDNSTLVLEERPEARRSPPGSSGLYHIAFTVDSLEGLSEALKRIVARRFPLLGVSDHGYTIAVYTMDPEGNGVEVYWDKDEPSYKLVTRPLAPERLLTLKSYKEYKASIGHIHVKVASLEEAERFYADLLRMRVTERDYPGALFFAYGNYHHHVAANIWETGWGARGKRPPEPSTGLKGYVMKPPKGEAPPPGVYVDLAGIRVEIL